MNTPLTSSDLGKILVFIIFMIPILIFGFGIIPAIFLIFGIVLMKKTQDFSHIHTAVKNFKIYMSLAIFIGFLYVLYWGNQYFVSDSYMGSYEDAFVTSLILTFVPVLYVILVNFLFLKPLISHCGWVRIHGFFPKKFEKKNDENHVNIIKGENLRSYSVADELTKWAQLKVDGHITEEEFEDARRKLLKK